MHSCGRQNAQAYAYGQIKYCTINVSEEIKQGDDTQGSQEGCLTVESSGVPDRLNMGQLIPELQTIRRQTSLGYFKSD